jgi:predicted ATPase
VICRSDNGPCENSITWSYELLNARQQRLFRRLAVFVGGGRLDLVERVCREPGETDADVLDGLLALVEHSLVRRDVMADGEPRLRMLETIREFALHQLEVSGEAEAIRRRHALACVELANTLHLGESEPVPAGRGCDAGGRSTQPTW